MQLPKQFSSLLSKLTKIPDKVLGEKPPPASVITAIINQNLQKQQAAAPAAPQMQGDWKLVLEQVKKDTIKEVDKKVAEFNTKTADWDKTIKELQASSVENKAKLEAMEKNIKKFATLYELVTNQVNPFIEVPRASINPPAVERKPPAPEANPAARLEPASPPKDIEPAAQQQNPQPQVTLQTPKDEDSKKAINLISVGGQTETIKVGEDHDEKRGVEIGDELKSAEAVRKQNPIEEPHMRDLHSMGEDMHSFIDLRNLNLQKPQEAFEQPEEEREVANAFKPPSYEEETKEAPDLPSPAGNKMDLKGILPLKTIKNDIYSLVTVLNWLKYFVERAGTTGTAKIFKSYANLGWITPEVYAILLKYLGGMVGENNETSLPSFNPLSSYMFEEKELDLLSPKKGRKGGRKTKTPVAKNQKKEYVPTIEDHMMSLFFISRLQGVKLNKEEYDKIIKVWKWDAVI